MYERDKRKPDYDTLLKIADFFEVSTDYLIRGESYRQTAERIVDNPEVKVAASDGEFTKEEKIKMLEWLLEAERGRKPGDEQKKK
ncbi:MULTISPECIES: helix-turn-helix domain-containing protein [Bacillus]|uniref:Transcriptional regulator with XRE-family HTH domain n=1 Tax=Bacillus capparidis TaxID=1840411 RepID=A0ABS4CTF7_9BACI|nr:MULTISPECIES: helix-turn-helix transcriptional regulator [Bacillus]MBP1080855.1 transcriptional regulator with XRE-family HTH domain [Bacillus capparidis]MED1097497.1 helix-turn-helix transcriptional regulator [Bacillus capparidis]